MEEKKDKVLIICGQVLTLTNVINHALGQMSSAITGNLPQTAENQGLHDMVQDASDANQRLADEVIERIEKEGEQVIERKPKAPLTRMKI